MRLNNFHLVKLSVYLIILIISTNCYPEPTNANRKNNKIAIVAPFTGSYAAYGKELLIAANQAITDLNAKLEMVPFDDQCNADLAKSIAHKIVNDSKIIAVIGHVCSDATMVASKIYAKHGILHIVPMSTNTKITEQNIATLFRMCGRDDIQAQVISNFIFKQFADKKIAILHNTDLYSKELASLVQEQLAMLRVFPIVYQSVTVEHLNNPIKTKNIVKKLKKLNVDLIFFGGLYKEIASLVKSLNYNKIKIPIIAPDSIATPGFVSSLGTKKIAAGTIMSFQKLDNITLPKSIQGQATFGYMAIQTINAALNNNNSKNGRILAHWLHHNKVNTILGDKLWDTNGNVMGDEFDMYVLDGEGNLSPIE